MQVEVAETGPCSRTLSFKVPPQTVREHLDQMYAAAGQQVQIKGFRPGHVPRKVLEKRFGPSILQEAKEQLVNRCFNDACRERQITPVGRAQVDDFDHLELSLQSPLEFKVKVDVRPTFTLGQVDGIEIERFETEATDQDIDNSLKEIANQKRAIRKVEEPAQDGDFVKVDLAFHDEAGAKVHERKGVQLNTRIPVAGTDPDQFAKAIVGATSGKGIELPLTFPDNFEKDAFRGHKGTARLQVHEVLRITAPPVDDALAKALDFASLAALRSDLQRRIGDEKRRLGKQQQEETVLQTLLQAHTFDLPQSLVDEQARQSLAQFAERLKQSGANDADIEKQLEDSKAEAQTDAQRRVRLFFLIDAVARREKLFVTEGDVDTEVKNIAQQNQATPAQVLEHLEQHQQLGELRLALLERKVRDFLTGRAKIVDRKGK